MLKPKAEDVEILVDAFNGGEVRHYTTGITTQHTTNHNTPPTTQHTTNRFAFWKTQRQSCRCCMVAQ